MARILLADDDAELRSIYSRCLSHAGHQVWEAADGAEAVALSKAHRPDLLVLDVWMPALNGFEVLEALRHDRTTLRMKVLMLSVLGDADTRLEAFSGGALAYLVKGISLSELVAKIEAALAGSEITATDMG